MVIKNTLKNKKILITCGPTWVPIDPVRVISNRSTGELGQLLAKKLSQRGAKVTLLEGPVAHKLKSSSMKIIAFTFYDDLLKQIKKCLKKRIDIVIHAAAVSDYYLQRPFKKKISSQLKMLRLSLVPTKKIINLIKQIRPQVTLIGFKLVSKASSVLAKKTSKILFQKAKCDMVVVNSAAEKRYRGYIIDRDQQMSAYASTRTQMANHLIRLLKKRR